MMKNGFRQSMAWLHTWTGLVLGWLLFAIFLMGSSAYFKEEISRWMKPEFQVQAVDNTQAANVALTTLQQTAPTATNWYITLPTERNPSITAYWQHEKGFNNGNFNPATGQKIVTRATQGGEFFYNFHFQLFGVPIIAGRIIVGISAMLMLVALVSGIITHKKIISDFFTFRPKKGQRSWLDFHNVTAVMSLPFFLMITYTGLAIFFYLYMPWGITARYGEDQGKFFDEIAHVKPDPSASGKPATMLPFDKLITRAKQHLNRQPIAQIEVNAPNDQNALISFIPVNHQALNIRATGVTFNAISGQLQPDRHNHSAMSIAAGAIYGLHMAHIANWPMRWLLFASGILGSCMIGSGLVLWTVKRRMQQKNPRFHVGHYLVERLNIATIIGLPTAMAGFFLANRIIAPVALKREALEIKVFFVVWLAMLIHSLLRPWQNAWKEQLLLAGLGFVAVPVINMLFTPQVSLFNSLHQGNWVFASFDLLMLGFGFTFWLILLYLFKNNAQAIEKMQAKIANRALAKQQVAAVKVKESTPL